MSVTMDTIGIAVKDMARSIAFYRLLGFQFPEGSESESHVESSVGGIHVDWDTVEILKQVYGRWDEPVGHRIELAFRCGSAEEVDSTYTMLIGAGHPGYKEPWDAFWGQRYAIVEDPDGNLISLFA